MNLTGTWKGEYTFQEIEGDDGKAKAVAGDTIAFTMQLQQGWLGLITGTIQDDARFGFPEPGKIKGRLKGTVFDFKKLMPVIHMLHESGRVTLEKWAERRKLVMDTHMPHPPIVHFGDLSADGNTLEGSWRMQPYSLPVPGSYEEAQIPLLGGTWTATRSTEI